MKHCSCFNELLIIYLSFYSPETVHVYVSVAIILFAAWLALRVRCYFPFTICKQACSQEFFRSGEVSENLGTIVENK